MMALALRHQTAVPNLMIARAAHGHGVNTHLAEKMEKIGNREVVGFGWNGEPTYYDRPDFPMPAIRFKESTPDVLVSAAMSLTIQNKKLEIFLNIF
jgi:cytochrome c oxidase subunit 4